MKLRVCTIARINRTFDLFRELTEGIGAGALIRRRCPTVPTRKRKAKQFEGLASGVWVFWDSWDTWLGHRGTLGTFWRRSPQLAH
jgi:hypothetical protein